MLFHSHFFIFLFLPISLIGFFWIGRVSRLAAAWLAAASLFFYGWWNPRFVGLLVVSTVFNYALGMALAGAHTRRDDRQKHYLLQFAVTANLVLLGYYKYANFFVDNLNYLTGWQVQLNSIILPLGISFFTFTQIAFLVDVSRGLVKEYKFLHYLLFVSYFPHLIAGPVLHHKELMPQFAERGTYRFSYENLAVGLTIFGIGLFKKWSWRTASLPMQRTRSMPPETVMR